MRLLVMNITQGNIIRVSVKMLLVIWPTESELTLDAAKVSQPIKPR